jgi:Exostosin family
MMENHGREGNHHDNDNNHNNNNNNVTTTTTSASSSLSRTSSSICVSSTYYVRRRLRLRRIFLVCLALGYAAIAIAIYRNILILVQHPQGAGTDNNFYLIAGGQPYSMLAQQPTDTDDDNDDDDSVVPLNDSTSHDDPRNHSASSTPLAITAATTTSTPTPSKKKKKRSFKFFMLNIPELTSDLVAQHWDKAYRYGQSTAAMNEDLAEIWLHRGLSNFTYEQGQTMDASEANVFFIPAYLHARDAWVANGKTTEQNRKDDILAVILNALMDTTKPHVLLIPTRDKSLGNRIGYRLVAQTLWDQGGMVHTLYSVGFERNSWWQVIPTDRIIPIPYVVKPQVAAHDLAVVMFDQANRTENFVFYAAHPRPSAVSFAGCNRSTVLPLQGEDNMEILLLSDRQQRLSQERYNHRMLTSDYCLVTCGDTPTSRSLASAMIAGCIPLRIGSWWRAICEAPCKKIHIGFNVAAQPHFPFADAINWSLVSPELDQVQFDRDPKATLAAFLHNNNTSAAAAARAHKDVMRVEMKRVQSSFIYGWGNPINSTQFGDVYKYLWNSIIHELQLQ